MLPTFCLKCVMVEVVQVWEYLVVLEYYFAFITSYLEHDGPLKKIYFYLQWVIVHLVYQMMFLSYFLMVWLAIATMKIRFVHHGLTFHLVKHLYQNIKHYTFDFDLKDLVILMGHDFYYSLITHGNLFEFCQFCEYFIYHSTYPFDFIMPYYLIHFMEHLKQLMDVMNFLHLLFVCYL
jgi:hypothetical protein